MVLKFTTKRDINGNRYTLIIDLENKIIKTGYNTSYCYSDYYELTKKSLNKMLLDFEKNSDFTILYV